MATRSRKVPWPEGGAAQQDQQPASTSRAVPVVAQSRFVEGSMNDRASAAPPPSFLGAGDAAAYEQQFYEADRPKPLRPVSSAGHYYHHHHHNNDNNRSAQAQAPQKQESSRKGGFWDGVKERFHLTRSRSSGNIPRMSDKESGRAATAPNPMRNEKMSAPPAAYPSREEVMESYKNLVASGFFDSHAIQGTRHPLRTTMSHSDARPTTTTTSMGPPPMSFAAHKQASSRKHPPVSFSAVPYSSTKSPTAAELPSSTCPPPPPRRPATAVDEVVSPQRGTKRGPAPLDGDSESTKGSGETGARKLVKKLRRSASRVSTELTGPTPALTNPFKGRPSTSSNAPTVMSVMSAVSTDTEGPAPQRTPTKLTKSKYPPRSTRGRGLTAVISFGNLNIARRRPRSPAATAPLPAAAPRRDITPNPLSMNPPVFAIPLVEDAMLVDSPERRSRSPERMSIPTTALAPANFHYPQRKRFGEPLSVVPDANRGIPGVPRIPAALVSPFGGPAREDIKMRDSGVGEDVENAVQVW
ncbi:hypothetical protein B0T14DRAFT_286530 [Immersiella caudata]|uniref:Uncharacterized protein n=1 Tax=Immersiella caudata TaxID=314043 RepID=A0AA39WEB5_9PEZI|nr:hypothetical protein B0T14DRAFT_286530 [Immersiella caudata]